MNVLRPEGLLVDSLSLFQSMTTREGARRLDFLIPSWLEDPTAFSQRPDLGFGAIASVTVANAVVSVVCLAIFEILRHRGAFFCPKAAYQPERVPAVVHFDCNGGDARGGYARGGARGRACRWPLEWVNELLSLDEETILQCAGFDALVYLRFITMAFKARRRAAPTRGGRGRRASKRLSRASKRDTRAQPLSSRRRSLRPSPRTRSSCCCP